MMIDWISFILGGVVAAGLIYGVSSLVIGLLIRRAPLMPKWMEDAEREQERQRPQLHLCQRHSEKVN